MDMANEKTKDNRLTLEKPDSKTELAAYGRQRSKNQFLRKLSVKEYCLYCGG